MLSGIKKFDSISFKFNNGTERSQFDLKNAINSSILLLSEESLKETKMGSGGIGIMYEQYKKAFSRAVKNQYQIFQFFQNGMELNGIP